MYPYDRSSGKVRFAMSNNDTVNGFNTSQGTFLIAMTGAVITDPVMNYQIEILNTAVCSEELGCQLDITLELQYPGLVKAVVILTVAINCEYQAGALCCRLLISPTFRAHHILDMQTRR